MSPRTTDNLSREKIQQLLTAIGSKQAEDTTEIEAIEYNWHEPHYFNSEQLVKLDIFAKKVAALIAKKFTDFCRSRFDVTVVSVTQHFAGEFTNQPSDDKKGDYYLPFGTDQEHLCGLVCIPEPAAVLWARQLLGDSGAEEDSNRELSQLEESLLSDLACSLVEAFSSPDTTCDFNPAGSIVRGQLPLELQSTEELCKISFDIKQAADAGDKQGSGAYFLIICSELEPIVTGTTQTAIQLSAEYISKAIHEHFHEMPVTIRAQLASASFSFEEVMNLQVDDILLLDKKVDQPVELVVDGLTIYYGWPAKSAGKYAVTVTETTFGDKA